MTDENHILPELTRRQEEILSLIVQSYSQSPEPVSSRSLVDSHQLSVSSATVRNEMSLLEELGYIAAPHTSAGRIPTAQGYRYFVQELIQNKQLSYSDQRHIETRFNTLPAVLEQWLRQAATILARTASTASIVTPPVSDNNQFKHVELISIQGRLALMVLVLQGGSVHQRMLHLADSVPQSTLSDVATRINTLCVDLKAHEIRIKAHGLSVLEHEVIELAAELMSRNAGSQTRIIYRDGLSEIINSFADNEGTQQAVRVFEERAFLDMLLTDILQPLIGNEDDVQVIIAGEGRWNELSQLSIVLSHYGIPGKVSGALGVLGPTHINYGKAINTVRHVSGLMTDMVINMYDTDENPVLDIENTEENTDTSQ